MMKRITTIATGILLVITPITVLGSGVQVDGYHRDDGTYVRSHVRSSPDDSISNNYGPSQDSSELMSPRSRDYDNDGISNYQDIDSDNDGLSDNFDSNPYSNDSNSNYGLD